MMYRPLISAMSLLFYIIAMQMTQLCLLPSLRHSYFCPDLCMSCRDFFIDGNSSSETVPVKVTCSSSQVIHSPSESYDLPGQLYCIISPSVPAYLQPW